MLFQRSTIRKVTGSISHTSWYAMKFPTGIIAPYFTDTPGCRRSWSNSAFHCSSQNVHGIDRPLVSSLDSGPIQKAMEHALRTDPTLSPLHHLEFCKESGQHNAATTTSSRGSSTSINDKTRFKVVLVSSRFEGKCTMECHRLVHACLSECLLPTKAAEPTHRSWWSSLWSSTTTSPRGSPPQQQREATMILSGLSIVARTPEQWNQGQQELREEPNSCQPGPSCTTINP